MVLAAFDGKMWNILSSWCLAVIANIEEGGRSLQMPAKICQIVLPLCVFGMLEKDVSCD